MIPGFKVDMSSIVAGISVQSRMFARGIVPTLNIPSIADYLGPAPRPPRCISQDGTRTDWNCSVRHEN